MDDALIKNVFHVLALLVLVISLIGVLIFTGILGCNAIPGGCDAYYFIVKGGQPNVLIAYGDGGLGDHEKLNSVLNNRQIIKGSVRTMPINRLSKGNINDFDLIIVENAKEICTDKLKVFQEYVTKGGRLVWTGDAGTEKCEGDAYLLDGERTEGGTDKVIGPWARRDGSKQVSFDEFLGLNYKDNFCNLGNCDGSEIGRIEITNDEHKLTMGLSPTIPFSQDFAIVKLNKGGTVRLVATLDYGTNFLGESEGLPWLNSGRTDFGKNLVFISSSQIGERVAYYATPIEAFVQEEKPYKALIEQMYYGLLYN